MIGKIKRAIATKKLKQLRYSFLEDSIYQKNNEKLILGKLEKTGTVNITYPKNIEDIQEILNFTRDLRNLKIKYSGDVSKTVINLKESIRKRKTLIGRLNRE